VRVEPDLLSHARYIIAGPITIPQLRCLTAMYPACCHNLTGVCISHVSCVEDLAWLFGQQCAPKLRELVIMGPHWPAMVWKGPEGLSCEFGSLSHLQVTNMPYLAQQDLHVLAQLFPNLCTLVLDVSLVEMTTPPPPHAFCFAQLHTLIVPKSPIHIDLHALIRCFPRMSTFLAPYCHMCQVADCQPARLPLDSVPCNLLAIMAMHLPRKLPAAAGGYCMRLQHLNLPTAELDAELFEMLSMSCPQIVSLCIRHISAPLLSPSHCPGICLRELRGITTDSWASPCKPSSQCNQPCTSSCLPACQSLHIWETALTFPYACVLGAQLQEIYINSPDPSGLHMFPSLVDAFRSCHLLRVIYIRACGITSGVLQALAAIPSQGSGGSPVVAERTIVLHCEYMDVYPVLSVADIISIHSKRSDWNLFVTVEDAFGLFTFYLDFSRLAKATVLHPAPSRVLSSEAQILVDMVGHPLCVHFALWLGPVISQPTWHSDISAWFCEDAPYILVQSVLALPRTA